METVGIGSTLESLRAGLRGTAYAAGEDGYDEASRAWNLNAHQEPALVVMAEGAADVMAAVRFARDLGVGVGVMATGHGVGIPCDGGVLVNTSRMRGVRVDPVARTARVEAGALWTDVIPETQAHGLAGLVGSTSHVGVVGYTMGGGFGWLGRRYGLNGAGVTEADVVTADGELLRVGADEHPDLFWGLGGGGGNFGIVTSLEFRVYPLTAVYGGNVFYPVEKAGEVLDLYARWSADLPDEMTTAVTFLNVPPCRTYRSPCVVDRSWSCGAATLVRTRRTARRCSVPRGRGSASPSWTRSGSCPSPLWTRSAWTPWTPWAPSSTPRCCATSRPRP